MYKSCVNWPFFRGDSQRAVFKIVSPAGTATGFFGRDYLGTPAVQFIFIVTAAHTITQAGTLLPPTSIEIRIEYDESRCFALMLNQLCISPLVARGGQHDWVVCRVNDAIFLDLSKQGKQIFKMQFSCSLTLIHAHVGEKLTPGNQCKCE